ncbi:MAG TPA: class I SAM-dependent methyltransferase [Candidatus Dormibacteraeota bacterium]
MSSRPDTYTHGHQDAVLRAHRWRTAENSAAHLLPLLRSGQRLLDVGSGPGTLTIDLARRVAPGQVVGIDLVDSVVEEARQRAAEAGVANLSFESGDFREAGLEEASFDVVHAHQVLQHLREPVAALAAMARLTRPGGIVAARDADYSAMTWAPADERLERWLRLYLAVARRNGAEPNGGRWLLRWARAAGLRDVTYTTSTWTFATPSDREWWGGLWAERTVASSFAEQAVRYEIATPADLELIAGGWREWAAQPDAVFVVVHGEIVARPHGPAAP